MSIVSVRPAEDLEVHLGSPLDPERPTSFRAAMEHDEAETFPEAGFDALRAWGFGKHLVPKEQGGKLRFDEQYHLVKVLARRDVSLAIANGTAFLGSVFTWIAGSDEQKQRLAELIGRGEVAALALTEETHGSDVLATELLATKEPDGSVVLSGTKWFINNVRRSAAMTVFAKVEGGEIALVLVDKEKLDASTFSYLPKFRTLGVRGLDIGGIRFDATRLPPGAIIGRDDRGMKTLMNGLYVTRAMCAPLALGAADTALRCTTAFAVDRRLYGDTVFQIPTAQSTLVDAFIDILGFDCVGLAAARAIHFAPELMSVTAAIAKYQVPTAMDAVLRGVAVVMGSRYFHREAFWWGIFQKMLRDGSVVPLFDGSTAVNLYVLGIQLGALAQKRASLGAAGAAPVDGWFALDRDVPAFRPHLMRASNEGVDVVVQTLPSLLERLRALPSSEPTAAIVRFAERLQRELDRHEQLLAAIDIQDRRELLKSPELVDAAKRYALLHSCIAMVHVWAENREKLGDFFAEGKWLALVLDRWLRPLDPNAAEKRLPREWRREMAAELQRRYEAEELFSIVPMRLAKSPAR